ncbi:MAG: Smr/MutS family protein [Bacteroidia bacterium]
MNNNHKTKSEYITTLPADAQDKVEFQKILELIAQRCLGSLGVAQLQKLKVYTRAGQIVPRLQQVDEFKRIIESGGNFPADHYLDLSAQLKVLPLENSVLSIEQMLEVLNVSLTCRGIYVFLSETEEMYPALYQLVAEDPFQREIIQLILAVLDNEGNIRPDVSPVLTKIRREIDGKERELSSKFNSLLREGRAGGYLAEGEESIKNSRRVLSVLAEHKRRVKGIIHDESASGRIVYIEPEKTTEISNEVFDLRQQERREIYRLMRELTASVRPFYDLLKRYQRILARLDFIRAKARFARDIGANMITIAKEPVIDLKEAFHPLLFLSHQAKNAPIVPLNLKLEHEHRILVISGPNAGGKSVCLKTVGLLQLMMQSGMLVTAKPNSRMGIFRELFVDIGDQQSIENDLSTYTSHLSNMKNFLSRASDRTLFLIDEFGTGTDPQLGGAIAEAILTEMNHKRAYGITTTHYANLKMLAEHTPGLLNGAMRFDHQTLSPAYELETGKPGSSYAFEIAHKIGLSKKLIDAARKLAGTSARSMEEMLTSLEKERQIYEERDKAIAGKEKHLDGLISTYTKLKQDLEENRHKILEENKQKALAHLNETNRKLENLVREIREEQKKTGTAQQESRDIVKEAKDVLNREKQQIEKDLKIIRKPKPVLKNVKPEDVKPGLRVKMGSNPLTGVVEEVRKNKVLVSFGSIKTLVDINKLQVSEDADKDTSPGRGARYNYMQAAQDFSPSIDVRGQRAEEALNQVELWLDQAHLLNEKRLRIIHGKGEGILRPAIRNLLKQHKQVSSYESESEMQGGEGITLVEMRE